MAKKPISHNKVNFEKAARYNPLPEKGLTSAEVKERRWNGYTNFNATVKTKSSLKIILTNALSIFNFVNILIAFALIYVGSYKNITFMGVILANLFIGIFQELRAKRATEKLSFISQAKVCVRRNGEIDDLPIDQLVLDDIIILKSGAQVVADCIILEGECEVNESFVTGESDSVYKTAGESLLSGSFVSSGECVARADKVANQTYISSISRSARTIKAPSSVLMKSLKRIITVIAIAIFPIGAMLFLGQFDQSGNDLQGAVVRTSAALLGMIPQGLMLLTSSALALSVVKLSKNKVLVKDLYCIEMLARVDTICLDKTGTLTEGSLYVDKLVQLDNGETSENSENLLAALAQTLGSDNATMVAIGECYNKKSNLKPLKKVPFSSKTKWSGVFFENKGSIILGAAEYIMPHNESVIAESKKYSNDYRVLLLAKSDSQIEFGTLPTDIQPIALVLLCDKIRAAAPGLVKYFNAQGVDVKIISGDNPITVSMIAKQCGVLGSEKYIDCSTLQTEREIRAAAFEYTVFGRVSPFQKKQIVLALKAQNHTVAMTGDGVNDVLAMKEADCSVAMGAGTDAARNVSKLVLLDSNFDALPSVIYEGRRSVNNIQRSAAFFLSKTIYSSVLAVVILAFQLFYPLHPIQQSFISVLFIGIPSFILALEPNKNRIEGSFFVNVLLKSLPMGITVTISTVSILFLSNPLCMTPEQTTSMTVFLLGFISTMLLVWVCTPINRNKGFLILLMLLLFFVGIVFARGILSLELLSVSLYFVMIGQMVMSLLLFVGLICASNKIQEMRGVGDGDARFLKKA